MSAIEKKRGSEGACEGEPQPKRARKEDSPAMAAWKKMMNYVEPKPFKPCAKVTELIDALRLVGKGKPVVESELFSTAMKTLAAVDELAPFERDEMMLALSHDKQLTACLKDYLGLCKNVVGEAEKKTISQPPREKKLPSEQKSVQSGTCRGDESVSGTHAIEDGDDEIECSWCDRVCCDEHSTWSSGSGSVPICYECQSAEDEGDNEGDSEGDHIKEETFTCSSCDKTFGESDRDFTAGSRLLCIGCSDKGQLEDTWCRIHVERIASWICATCKGHFCSTCEITRFSHCV